VDPNIAPVRREERDLIIAANNAYLLAFDNLSGLPPWMSDALCRLASIDPPRSRRNRQHPGRAAEAHWRRSNNLPFVRPDLHCAPALVSKVEVDVPACSAIRTCTARWGASKSARASSKSSVDRIAAASRAVPVAS
jgi:hypothetical protein